MTLAIELRSAFGLAVGYRAMVCRRSFIYSLLVSCRWSTLYCQFSFLDRPP